MSINITDLLTVFKNSFRENYVIIDMCCLVTAPHKQARDLRGARYCLKKNAGFRLCNKLLVKTRWNASTCIVLFENVIKTYPFHNV